MIDPSAVSLVQTIFITHINNAFHLIAHYASNLLFIFAVFEIVLFGLLSAFGQNTSWSELLFKVIKIGLIFFIIQNYTWLLNIIIGSFAQIGGSVANTSHLGQYIFNPAMIWQFGYNIGLGLLQISAVSSSIGLVILLTILGFGILFVFGLLGIQIVIQLVAFYLVALIALIMLPLGVFNPSAAMFDRSVQAVLKAGVRVAVLIMVIGIAVAMWNSSALVVDHNKININQILGLFFTSLLFLYLAIKLPTYAASAVGLININSGRKESFNAINMVAPVPHGHYATAGGELSSIRIAATVEPMSHTTNGNGMSTANAVTGSSAITQTQMASGIVSSGNLLQQNSDDNLRSASAVKKSISDETLKKIKNTFVQAIKESSKKSG